MLKRYADESRVHWVGKAWEIRSAIRRLKQEQGGSARLAEVLNPSPRNKPVR